jgi:DTW domain-containing protein YfiP
MRKSAKKKSSIPRDPKPDLLKIDGDWQDAVKMSLAKKKPVTDWPK